LGISTCSARAATIFDLVIGFGIESILLGSGMRAGISGERERHSTCPARPDVNRISAARAASGRL
jgi:hypothetical protein